MQALFIDVATQKTYIENFGANAIEDAPEIRENLMNLTHLALLKKIPILSLLHMTQDSPEMLEKVMDTEVEQALALVENAREKYANYEFANWQDIDFALIQNFIESQGADTIFIYGVPLELLSKIARELGRQNKKIWIVVDAVKSPSGEEKTKCKALKTAGLKTMTTFSLQAYLNL